MIRVGQRLYEERVKKGLSVDEVAQATRIRPQFITAIETGNYKNLPSSAYVLGFVKNYISFLGLPAKQLIPLFRREFNEKEHIAVLPESFTYKQAISIHRIHIRRIISIILLIALPFLFYIFFQYRAAFLNPRLIIQTPSEHAYISSDTITVTGRTDPNVLISVNEATVFVDSNGLFRKNITVFSGQKTVIVKAVNSFGRSTVLTRHVVVK